MEKTVPTWKKYTLSVEEASDYFNIGVNRIRALISENEDADYVLWKNSRPSIKRIKFEHYIDSINVL